MNIQIKKPCSIYKMNGNTCSVCNTIVHDVTNMSNEEILELLKSNCKVCIAAKTSQLKLTWLQVAAAFFISMFSFCAGGKKQPILWRGIGSFVRYDSATHANPQRLQDTIDELKDKKPTDL